MEKFKFSSDYKKEVNLFLTLYADDIYSDCLLKNVITFEEIEEQHNVFSILDAYLNKIIPKFELELFLEKSPEIMQFYSLQYKKRTNLNIPKKIALHEKLANYYSATNHRYIIYLNIKLIYN